MKRWTDFWDRVYNRWSKNFNERPHRLLVTLRGCECIHLMLMSTNKWFLRPTRVSPQTVCRSVQPF